MSRDIDKLWQRFNGVSRARIALGRVGDALPTQRLLDFDYAHACARDAVLAGVDFTALAAALHPTKTLYVHSAAMTARCIYDAPTWVGDCPRKRGNFERRLL